MDGSYSGYWCLSTPCSIKVLINSCAEPPSKSPDNLKWMLSLFLKEKIWKLDANIVPPFQQLVWQIVMCESQNSEYRLFLKYF
jgi:hypothetical protein